MAFKILAQTLSLQTSMTYSLPGKLSKPLDILLIDGAPVLYYATLFDDGDDEVDSATTSDVEVVAIDRFSDVEGITGNIYSYWVKTLMMPDGDVMHFFVRPIRMAAVETEPAADETVDGEVTGLSDETGTS